MSQPEDIGSLLRSQNDDVGRKNADGVQTPSESEALSDSESSRHSTTTFRESVTEMYDENGRRYCNQQYHMPNDDDEQTRLAIAHQAYLPILDGQLTLGLIPRNAKRILDIGTGTGDWAIAIAERFPRAEVIATDITDALQPATAPPSLFFELDDAQDEWAYTELFDFIHVRGLTGAFRDWGAIYREISKHLKSGGSCEIADFGLIRFTEQPSSSYVSAYNGAILSAAAAAGTPINLDHLGREALEKAGLSVTKVKKFDVPLGTWSPNPTKKAAGKMALISVLEGLEATSLRLLTRHLAWKAEDVRDLCEKVKSEVMKPDARAYVPVHYVVARKLM